MIQARTPERIYELIRKGIDCGANAFGLQFEQLERKYHTPKNFKEIFSRMNGLPAYVTNYRYVMNEGMTDKELAEELLTVAECGGELIDIMGDMFCPTPDQITYDEKATLAQEELIIQLHEMNKRVLISSHTYRYLPYGEIYGIAKAQKNRGADVAKIVTAATTETELYSNFEISAKLKQEFDGEFLFLCVGEHSYKHRRISPMITGGMWLCVAEHDELSTPAQPLLSEAIQIMKNIYGENK